jgi:hypothetical protein
MAVSTETMDHKTQRDIYIVTIALNSFARISESLSKRHRLRLNLENSRIAFLAMRILNNMRLDALI